MTRKISKTKLKAQMLAIFREIEDSGDELVVTDRDKPVLLIIPIKRKRKVSDVFAPYLGQVTFNEDPDTPTGDEWEDA